MKQKETVADKSIKNLSIYNPNYYADAKDDSAMIQEAIDAAAQTGEKVIIPRRNLRTEKDIWIIPRSILLHTGSVVILNNCHLRQAKGVFENIFKNANGRTDKANTLNGRQYDIRICGIGNAILDGGLHNRLTERNQNKDGMPRVIQNTMIHFHNTERVTIENLRILHQRYWSMAFHYCSFCRISNIDFMGSSNAPQQDGIDVRVGCNSFIIENITGFTQDDTVALTCMGFGDNLDVLMKVEKLDDSIHNVIIRNICTNSTCGQVRLLNHEGKKLYNVIIENVQNFIEIDPADVKAAEYQLRLPYGPNYVIGSETSMAASEANWKTFAKDQRPGVSVRIGDNHYYSNKDNPQLPSGKAKLGDTYNITVRNIQSRARFGVIIACTLADSVFENIQMFGDSMTAVYFNEGVYRNIRMRNICYAHNSCHRLQDEKYEDSYKTMYKYDNVAAVYFYGSDVKNLSFDGLTAGIASKAVFGGSGKVELCARDVICRSKETKLVEGQGISVILHSSEGLCYFGH